MAASAFVGVTDEDWFRLLRSLESVDEINFWQPSGGTTFKALLPGEPFLFKLHRRDFIVGGGFFAYWTRLPLFLAWEAFEAKKGATTMSEMQHRVDKYRGRATPVGPNAEIGCILLQQPFFFDESEWIPLPDWKPNIVRGRGYDLDIEPGRAIWREIEMRLAGRAIRLAATGGEAAERYGEPILVRPRLGQGSFRILVTDAYRRRCAVTGEKVLPVLEAAHIRPYSDGGEHRVDNGLLLRSDLHTLFDRGYLTVTPKHRVEISARLKADFDNGKHYYALHGQPIELPSASLDRPDSSLLEWHNENRFVA